MLRASMRLVTGSHNTRKSGICGKDLLGINVSPALSVG